MEKNKQVIQPSTMILPHLDHEVPVLSLADGPAYILAIALRDAGIAHVLWNVGC